MLHVTGILNYMNGINVGKYTSPMEHMGIHLSRDLVVVFEASSASLFEARQIWQFSKVRGQSPKAVDQVGTYC